MSTFSHQFMGHVFPSTFELVEASLATKQWIGFKTKHKSEQLLVLAVDLMPSPFILKEK